MRGVTIRAALLLLCLLPTVAASPVQGPLVPVEAPAPAPAETEAAGPSLAVQALERELGRLAEHRAALDVYEKELLDRRAEAREAMEQSRLFAAESTARLQPMARGAAEVDAVYREVVGRLEQRQQALAESLERWRFASNVPGYSSTVDEEDLDTPGTADRVERIRTARAATREIERELRELERAVRRERVEFSAASVSRLYRVRTRALGKLPRARRAEELGATSQGLEALKLEAERLGLAARAYAIQTLQWLRDLPGFVNDLFAVGRASWALLKLIALFGLFVIFRRRYGRMREAMHGWVTRNVATRLGRRRLHGWVDGLWVVAPWLVVLALLRGIVWALGSVSRLPEVGLPLELITLYVVYRLINDVVLAGSLALARAYRVRVDEERQEQVRRTVRLIMRVAVAIVALLIASESLLGRGLLFTLVVKAAWAVGLLTFVVLLGRWRPVIAESYLRHSPTGRLAAMVRATKERWYGVFVAAAAFVWVAGRGIAMLVRDFAMQFDATRRALAFVFRRKMEKRAEKSGYADIDETELPEAIRDAFSPRDLDAELLIERYPGLDALHEAMGRWREGESRGSFLLSGRKGIGKSAWMQHVDPGETPMTRIPLDHRVQSESGLAEKLARAIGIEDAECSSLKALGKALREGPQRVIALDRMQNLFLARVGGYRLVEDFVSLIELTSEKVFWICSISGFACDHLFAVHPELMIFRQHQQLARWSEAEIGALIAHRTRLAGVEWDYDALIAEGLGRRVADDLVEETAEGYIRLIWDYSDGNPRVALHFWLRSIVPTGRGKPKIKLFRPPDPDTLTALGNRAMFLLAAIVTHENLSLREAAQVTRYPDAVCRIQLERMRDSRMLELEQGRYRLTTHWMRAILVHLNRNNLLPD